MKHGEQQRHRVNKIVTPVWVRQQRLKVAGLRYSRESNPQSDTVLIIPAAQHPLLEGRFPGAEFTLRLEAAQTLYQNLQDAGRKAEFFLPGSRLHDSRSGQTDEVALYDAAGLWLIERGVPADILHGKDWIQDRPDFTGADDIRVAAQGFLDHERFESAIYICSPGQRSRADWYALAQGVPIDTYVPETIEASGVEQFQGSLAQQVALNGLARTIDPYGDGVLARMTSDRMPSDGNPDTIPELLPEYSQLPWYR